MAAIRTIILTITLAMLFFTAMGRIIPDSTRISRYQETYNRINTMLQQGSTDFKTAVYYVENTYYNGAISYDAYNTEIRRLATLAKAYLNTNHILYSGADSQTIGKYAAAFKIMTDSIPVMFGDTLIYHQPYHYNFSDFDGSVQWSDMFVSTLLETHAGNCHSMPYLYKIILQEMGTDAYFALAPNHIYVKLFSQKDGWYNTELTSGDFPIDAWIMVSGYVHLSAIQNGIYMDTIGNNKALAMCLIDLAQCLEAQDEGPAVDSFTLQCCVTALSYFPNYINALLLQSKVYERQFSAAVKAEGYKTPQDYIDGDKEGAALFARMNALASQIHDLGYRRMPLKMYIEWLSVLKTQRDKYSNKKIANFNR